VRARPALPGVELQLSDRYRRRRLSRSHTSAQSAGSPDGTSEL
jgi:hypothetical protein